jgi:hypothetical protein
MAFKMNPGRGNYAKTGRSIPTPFKQVDREVDEMIARKVRRDENEKKAVADSTSVDKKLRDAGFGKITAGEMGNKKANETRSLIKDQFDSQIIRSVDKDKTTGKYKRNYKFSKSPAKQVDKEVEAMIAKKKESDAKAKTEKARSEGEAMRKKLEQDIKNKIMAETSKRASADSTAIDKKLRNAGFGPITAGEMGNKKANETRKAGTAYKNIYEKVVLDKSTGKYKKVIGSNTGDVPARQMKKSPAKQLGRQAVTKMGGKKTPAKMKKC